MEGTFRRKRKISTQYVGYSSQGVITRILMKKASKTRRYEELSDQGARRRSEVATIRRLR